MSGSSVYLLPEEIVAITGYRQKSKQRAWLRKNKVAFTENAFGHPIVARSQWEQSNGQPRPRRHSCPRWDALEQSSA